MEGRRQLAFFVAFIGVAFTLGSVPLFFAPTEEKKGIVSSSPETPEPVDPRGANDGVGEAAAELVADAAEVRADPSPLELPLAESAWSSADSLGCPSTDLRVLVLAADGEEPTLPAIRQALDYLGTPYSVHVAAQDPGGLTPERLSDGCRGFYQGVILTNGDLAYDPDGEAGDRDTVSALSDAEWQALRSYEARFDVRRVAWYASPTAEYGLQDPQPVDTADRPVAARYTEAGREVFSYANADEPLTIRDVFAYPAAPAGAGTTPLLTDEGGNVLAATAEHPDGRETLALTFNSNAFSEHNLVLDHGLVDWATGGLFLGESRAYLGAQVDDLFIPNAIYRTDDRYRITGEDLRAVLGWQRDRQRLPTTEQLRLDMAFNAYGTTGVYSPDTLTPVARRHMGEFKWISHTYKHLDWDELDYGTALSELRDNNAWAQDVGLEGFEGTNLVTPEISGLENPEAMRAAADAGVRYLVSDASKPEWDTPAPNTGFPHPLEPSIFVIPRYPNNLGYDVSTPEEWVAQYNDRYRDTWGRNLSYEEVLDKESDVLLSYLLKGDIEPWMFHQANLRAYDDGGRTLLTDLLDRTLQKYDALLELPVLSPTQDEVGRKMAERAHYNEAGVQASVAPGESIALTAGEGGARVPVTGLRADGAESYGDRYTSYVGLDAGESVTLPLE